MISAHDCCCGLSSEYLRKIPFSSSFPNLGIQCAKKKDIPTALEERQKLGVDPFNLLASGAVGLVPNNDYEMNVVCLCFQAFLPDPHHPDRFTRALPPKVTVPIYDKSKWIGLELCLT